jgi:hypothetical protein
MTALRFIRTAEIKPYVIFIKSPPFQTLQQRRQKHNAVFVYEGNARPFTVSINKLYFIVSAPRIFPLLYKLARPLISEDMKEKIHVAAGNYTFI